MDHQAGASTSYKLYSDGLFAYGKLPYCSHEASARPLDLMRVVMELSRRLTTSKLPKNSNIVRFQAV